MLLETIFKWVLYSSAMGGVLTILIIALKSIMGFRLSAKWHYYIWLLLIVRLILPFAPTSSVSISNLFAPFQNMYNTETSQYKDTDFLKRNDIENTPETPIGVNGAGQFKNEDIKSESNEILRGNQGTNKAVNGSLNFNIISYVWLSGMLMMLILVVLINIKLAFNIRRKSVCTDETLNSLINSCKDEMGIKSEIVLLSGDDFKTPMLFSLKKHKLLLPSSIINNMTVEEKRHIILHELAHLKRKDHIFSWVIVFLKIIHWFNPVIWFAFKKMRQDAESACDADVLSYVQSEKHKEYGNTIIKTVKLYSEPYFIPGVSTIGGCSGIKRRLSMIMNFNKYSAKWSILAVGIVIILAVSGLTNASISEDTSKKGTLDKTRSSEKILFVSSEDTIYFPDKVLTDRQLIELRGLVSIIPQHLNQHVRNQIMPLLSSYNDRWKSEFLPLLEKSKEIEIVNFVNDVNSGFKLAYEAAEDNETYLKQMTPENKMYIYEHQYFGEREEGNQKKLEQARDIFVKLGKRLPNVLPNKDIMLEDVRKLLTNNKEITIEEAKRMIGFEIVKPKYLPQRFKYSGIYVNKNDIGYPNPMIRQVWYDLDKFEMLMVTESTRESKDLNYEVIFSDKMEGPGKISDIYSWAKYRSQYYYIKNNHSVEGYMLVNNEANRSEYDKILQSLK